MKKTLLVMRHEINATLHRTTFVLFAFGIPVLMGLVALIVMLVSPDAGAAPIPISETGRSAVSGQAREGYVDPGGLIQALPADAPAGWLARYPSEAAAQAALKAGEITGYYLIPADYAKSGQLVYALPEYSPLGDDVPTDGIERVLLFNLLGGDAALAAQVRNPLAIKTTALASVQAEKRADGWVGDVFPTLMVFILYLVILMPASGLIAAITNEKKNRVMEVLATSASPVQMIGGKIIALGLLGLLQTALWVGVTWAVITFGRGPLAVPAGFTLPSGLIFWSFVYFLGGYAIYGALMAGLGALAPDIKDARGTTMVILSPMILAYMFNVITLEQPNGLLALVLSLFPFTSPVSMIARMTSTTVPVWQTAVAAGLQFLAAAWVVRMVARLFRAQTLLSGQTFSTGLFLRALVAK
ncbi:MAG: ABC transporter permease [Chloroflexi bacterium]|nr:ABC transporter permease [Chloroflexota bacterium]